MRDAEDEPHAVRLRRLIACSRACLDRTHALTVRAAEMLRRIARDQERWQAQEIERQVWRELGDQREADE